MVQVFLAQIPLGLFPLQILHIPLQRVTVQFVGLKTFDCLRQFAFLLL